MGQQIAVGRAKYDARTIRTPSFICPLDGFIFSREGLAEESGVVSLYEHANSLEKLTTVKRVARVLRDLTPQL